MTFEALTYKKCAICFILACLLSLLVIMGAWMFWIKAADVKCVSYTRSGCVPRYGCSMYFQKFNLQYKSKLIQALEKIKEMFVSTKLAFSVVFLDILNVWSPRLAISFHVCASSETDMLES